ncbi:MAG TPA: Fe-S cluster assembly protein IscX [Candidatus Aphodousia gallistercoris]|nr:Fe-S cluster assembly protein IscX [Candidatus Aphodousia gallistercoris]
MRWKDAREIGEALAERYPEVDPLKLRFTELHDMVVALEGFDDDPEKSTEAILEAILQVWLDER